MTALTEAEQLLAEHFYGYGQWSAPYWFIGLEQGQSKDEGDDLTSRASAFRELQHDGLCDCRKFHERIGLAHWHRRSGGKIPAQSTWRKLMLTLFALKRDDVTLPPTSLDQLRLYQAKQWGSEDGETCVVDLSGLAANNISIPRDRKAFLDKRLDFLHDKMKSGEPRFVVIYGKSQLEHWLSFWRSKPEVVKSGEFWKLGRTTIAFKATQWGQFNREWVELGERLRSV